MVADGRKRSMSVEPVVHGIEHQFNIVMDCKRKAQKTEHRHVCKIRAVCKIASLLFDWGQSFFG